jgi:hypothetical protein
MASRNIHRIVMTRNPRSVDFFSVEGIIRIRELPADCSLEDFRAWWPRLTEREKDRYTVQRFHNLLTTAGKASLLAWMATLPAFPGGTITGNPFAQNFAIGTGVVTGIFASDTTLFTQAVSKQITTATSTPPQIDYSTFFATTDFNHNTATNGGLLSASGGTLLTHFACSYTAGTLPFTFDYLLNIQ